MQFTEMRFSKNGESEKINPACMNELHIVVLGHVRNIKKDMFPAQPSPDGLQKVDQQYL